MKNWLGILLAFTLISPVYAKTSIQGCAQLAHSSWQGSVIFTDNSLVPVTFNIIDVTTHPHDYILQGNLHYSLNNIPADSALVGVCLEDADHGIVGVFLHNDDNDDRFEAGQYHWNGKHNILFDLAGQINAQTFYNGQVFN